MLEAYCFKCKKFVEMMNIKEQINPNKVKMFKGECPYCNKIVCRIVKKNEIIDGKTGFDTKT